MSNINLTTGASQQEENIKILGAGTWTLIGILIFLCAVYGGIILYGNKKLAEKATADEQYSVELEKLTSEKNQDIVGFQNRITLAENLLNKENKAYNNLPNIEKTTVSGVYLKSLTYDESKQLFSVEGSADNYDVFAKQISSYKESHIFSEISTGDSKLDDKGRVNFSLELKVK